MKTKFIIPFLTLIVLFSNTTYSNSIPDTDPDKDRVIVYVLKNILGRYHYVQKELNDDFSEHVYTTFIDGLDPSKRYFTQEDLKEFSQYQISNR